MLNEGQEATEQQIKPEYISFLPFIFLNVFLYNAFKKGFY